VAAAAGRTALITGASSGIGLAAARALLERDWTVVCASRPGGGGAGAVDRLRRETGQRRVHFLGVDLRRPTQVAALADAFRARFGNPDVLVNNAGAYFHRRRLTEDGFESTFALNHLGAFVLTACLGSALVEAGGRVVTVSSNMARVARLQLDDPHSQRHYVGWWAYAWSKLCNQLFTRELARRLEGTGASAFVMHPGFVATGLGHADGAMGTGVRLAQRLFGRSAERGADTVVWLAGEPELAGPSGTYFVDRRVAPVAPRARDEAAQQRLWTLSEALVADAGVALPALAAGGV
jgi:NAD(P)-dependent dehydrogenase (short-subunit alcohol dehydrogenase family)